MPGRHYRELLDRAREIALLDSSASLLAWDQETMMPVGGIDLRARQLAQLAALSHERMVAPELGELLVACEADPEIEADPRGDAAVNVRELRRSYDRQTRLPSALVREWAELTSRAQHEWAQARAASDFGRFLPFLERLVQLARHKAECLGWPHGGEAWDALADAHEPGASARSLSELFTPLRARLSELVGRLRDRGTAPSDRFVRVRLDIAQQEAFVRFVAERLGFDFARGRLDRSAHPFSIGMFPGDVRITTRFHDDDLLDALGSTMHEVGHGLYEQGLPLEHAGTPLGESASVGIHESQSRLWENRVGRSHAFWRWCHPHLERFFGSAVDGFDLEEVWRAANRVEPGLVRVEADEATYDLHVMVRFELELTLLRGELEAAGVPAEWNRLYREHLGVEVPDDRRGCLQDVHWSAGMFGYFPTYTLGNLHAAQLFSRARQDLGELEEQLARGEFAPLLGWLREHVHRQGRRQRPSELCEGVTGAPLSAAPLLELLEEKLADVYRI